MKARTLIAFFIGSFSMPLTPAFSAASQGFAVPGAPTATAITPPANYTPPPVPRGWQMRSSQGFSGPAYVPPQPVMPVQPVIKKAEPVPADPKEAPADAKPASFTTFGGPPMPYPAAPTQATPAPPAPPKPPVEAPKPEAGIAQQLAAIQQHNQLVERRLSDIESHLHIAGSPAPAAPASSKPAPADTASYNHYQVRIGETLASIAEAHRISVEDLRALNRRPDYIVMAGEYLLVPAKQVALKKEAPTTVPATTHIIRQGETLSEIGAAYHVSVNKLKDVNRIRDVRRLQPGQKLTIPGRSGPAVQVSIKTKAAPAPQTPPSIKDVPAGAPQPYPSSSAAPPAAGKLVTSSTPKTEAKKPAKSEAKPPRETVVLAPTAATGLASTGSAARSLNITGYHVEHGDTIESVARSHNTTAQEIQRINRLATPKLPPPGDEIVVPVPQPQSL